MNLQQSQNHSIPPTPSNDRIQPNRLNHLPTQQTISKEIDQEPAYQGKFIQDLKSFDQPDHPADLHQNSQITTQKAIIRHRDCPQYNENDDSWQILGDNDLQTPNLLSHNHQYNTEGFNIGYDQNFQSLADYMQMHNNQNLVNSFPPPNQNSLFRRQPDTHQESSKKLLDYDNSEGFNTALKSAAIDSDGMNLTRQHMNKVKPTNTRPLPFENPTLNYNSFIADKMQLAHANSTPPNQGSIHESRSQNKNAITECHNVLSFEAKNEENQIPFSHQEGQGYDNSHNLVQPFYSHNAQKFPNNSELHNCYQLKDLNHKTSIDKNVRTFTDQFAQFKTPSNIMSAQNYISDSPKVNKKPHVLKTEAYIHSSNLNLNVNADNEFNCHQNPSNIQNYPQYFDYSHPQQYRQEMKQASASKPNQMISGKQPLILIELNPDNTFKFLSQDNKNPSDPSIHPPWFNASQDKIMTIINPDEKCTTHSQQHQTESISSTDNFQEVLKDAVENTQGINSRAYQLVNENWGTSVQPFQQALLSNNTSSLKFPPDIDNYDRHARMYPEGNHPVHNSRLPKTKTSEYILIGKSNFISQLEQPNEEHITNKKDLMPYGSFIDMSSVHLNDTPLDQSFQSINEYDQNFKLEMMSMHERTTNFKKDQYPSDHNHFDDDLPKHQPRMANLIPNLMADEAQARTLQNHLSLEITRNNILNDEQNQQPINKKYMNSQMNLSGIIDNDALALHQNSANQIKNYSPISNFISTNQNYLQQACCHQNSQNPTYRNTHNPCDRNDMNCYCSINQEKNKSLMVDIKNSGVSFTDLNHKLQKPIFNPAIYPNPHLMKQEYQGYRNQNLNDERFIIQPNFQDVPISQDRSQIINIHQITSGRNLFDVERNIQPKNPTHINENLNPNIVPNFQFLNKNQQLNPSINTLIHLTNLENSVNSGNNQSPLLLNMNDGHQNINQLSQLDPLRIQNDMPVIPAYPKFCFDSTKIIHFIKYFVASENGVGVDKYLISDSEFIKFSELISEDKANQLIRNDSIEGIIINFQKLSEIQATFVGAFGRSACIMRALVDNQVIKQEEVHNFEKHFKNNGSGLYLLPICRDKDKMKIILILYSDDQNDFDKVNEKKNYYRLLRYLTQLCNVNILAINQTDINLINFVGTTKELRHTRYIPLITQVEEDKCELRDGNRLGVEQPNATLIATSSHSGYCTKNFFKEQKLVKSASYKWKDAKDYNDFFKGKNVKIHNLIDINFSVMDSFFNSNYCQEYQTFNEEMKAKIKQIGITLSEEMKVFVTYEVELDKIKWVLTLMRKYAKQKFELIKNNLNRHSEHYRNLLEKAFKIVLKELEPPYNENDDQLFLDIFLSCEKIALKQIIKKNGLENINLDAFLDEQKIKKSLSKETGYESEKSIAYKFISKKINERKQYFESKWNAEFIENQVEIIQTQTAFINNYNYMLLDDAFELYDELLKRSSFHKNFKSIEEAHRKSFISRETEIIKKNSYLELIKNCLEKEMDAPNITITKIECKNSYWPNKHYEFCYEGESIIEAYFEYQIYNFELANKDIENSREDSTLVLTPRAKLLKKIALNESYAPVDFILMRNGKLLVLANRMGRSYLRFYNIQKLNEDPITPPSYGNEILKSDYNESQKRIVFYHKKERDVFVVVYFIGDNLTLRNEGDFNLTERSGINEVKSMKLGNSNDIFVLDDQSQIWRFDYKNSTGRKIKITIDSCQTLLLIPDTDCLLLLSQTKIFPYMIESEKALPEIQLDFEFDPSSIFVSKFDTQIQLLFKNIDGVNNRLLKCSLSTKSYSLTSRNNRVDVNINENNRQLCILDYFKFLYYKFSVYNPMEDFERQIISQRLLIYMDHYFEHNQETEAKIRKKLTEIQDGIKKPYGTNVGLSSNIIFWIANQNNSQSLFTFSRPKTLDQWIQEVISFVPIQIARTENNQYLIIQNGSPMKLDNTNNVFDLQNKISFGLYESIFNCWNKDIKVISSMGKQSTGKSYTLNHLSGATFAISAGRCTDGCWFTIKITKDCLYVLMDFEGLGSFERSEQEDMLLSLTNASLSSITLFKTEYSINKDTDQMFNRFNQGANILKGNDKIFKGVFCILIKDVNEADVKGLTEEFREKMDVIIKRENQKDFITTMYKGGFDVYPFPSLALEDYYEEINNLKSFIQEIKPTFNNGKEFLNLLKTIMAKIAIQDFTSLSRQDIDMRKHILKANLEIAFTYGNLSENRERKSDFIFKSYDQAEIVVEELIELEIIGSNDETMNISYDDPDIDLNPRNKCFIGLLNRYKTKTRDNYVLWIELYRKLVKAIVAKRIERVQKWVDINLKKWTDVVEFQDDISKFKQEVLQKSKEIETNHQICLEKCDQCYSSCVLVTYHSDTHICDFDDHKCKDKCGYCQIENEEQYCKLDFGHPEQHTCDTKNHSCGLPCKYIKCKNECNNKTGHTGDHQCALSQHSCPKICSLDTCTSRCCISADKYHTIHKCVSDQCSKFCEIQPCKIRCACNNHFHGNFELSKTFKLENEIEDSNSGFIYENGNYIDLNFHCCGNEHQCDYNCSEKGFCKVIVERKIVQEEFKGNRGQFIFTKQFENIGNKEKCYKKISPFQRTHEGDHTHTAPDPSVIHTCENRCPTCNNICEKEFGHKGKHNTTHGNMEKCTFISNQKDFDVGDHNYVAGESSVAEMCHMFCKKLGRGHIHVIPCGSTSKDCINEEKGIRRHESCPYGPDEKNSKDEILHDAYWNLINFEDPCQKVDSETFSKCPFYCGSTIHSKDSEKKYCQLDLWHPKITTIDQVGKIKGYISSDGHYFECSHPISNQGFHFVFCLDDSGSMSGNPWKDLSAATADFVLSRRSSKTDSLSIVQFSDSTKIMCENIPFDKFDLTKHLAFRNGGTRFGPAIKLCHDIIKRNYNQSLIPVFIFMSDGGDSSGDPELVQMNTEFGPHSLKIFIIAFGSMLEKLKLMAKLVGGQYLTSINGVELRSNFMDISSQFGTTVGVISSHK